MPAFSLGDTIVPPRRSSRTSRGAQPQAVLFGGGLVGPPSMLPLPFKSRFGSVALRPNSNRDFE